MSKKELKKWYKNFDNDRKMNTYVIAGKKIQIPEDADDEEARKIVRKATKGAVNFTKSKGTYKI